MPILSNQRVGSRRIKPTRRKQSVALTLVAAEYEESNWVQLTFDRPIDIAGIVAGQVTVNDGPMSATLWQGDGPGLLINPTTVRIELGAFDVSTGTETLLNAGAGNGIVAVDDGGAWAGVSDLALPFP